VPKLRTLQNAIPDRKQTTRTLVVLQRTVVGLHFNRKLLQISHTSY